MWDSVIISGLNSSVGRVLARYARGHGFESRLRLDFLPRMTCTFKQTKPVVNKLLHHGWISKVNKRLIAIIKYNRLQFLVFYLNCSHKWLKNRLSLWKRHAIYASHRLRKVKSQSGLESLASHARAPTTDLMRFDILTYSQTPEYLIPRMPRKCRFFGNSCDL